MCKAREFAINAHDGQKYGEHPYVYHLDKVAAICQPFGEDYVTTAYLHDVIEDTDVTGFDIAEIFGAKIAMLVELCTDEQGQSRTIRKGLTNRKLAGVNKLTAALVVKAADRLANVRESVETNNESKLQMYRKEHAAFHKAVYRSGLCDAIWAEMDALLGTEDGVAPNRLEKRGAVYPRGVLQVCLDVHMTSTGSLNRDREHQLEDMRLLQTVIETWDRSKEKSFDMVVKALVGITLAEAMP